MLSWITAHEQANKRLNVSNIFVDLGLWSPHLPHEGTFSSWDLWAGTGNNGDA